MHETTKNYCFWAKKEYLLCFTIIIKACFIFLFFLSIYMVFVNMQIILFFSLIPLISPQEILVHTIIIIAVDIINMSVKQTIIPNAADNTEFIFLKS